MGLIMRRYLEFLFSNIVLSVLIAVLYELGLLSIRIVLECVVLLATSIYFIVNTILMRRCYFFLNSKYKFYMSNYTAYILFFITNMLCFFFCDKKVFTWLFAITKFSNLLNYRFAVFYSVMFFHLIMLGLIGFATVGMSWLNVYKKEEDWIQEVYFGDENE